MSATPQLYAQASSSPGSAAGIAGTAAAEVADEDLGSGETVDTFADYAPRKVRIGKCHPDPVVETASMSSVPPPNPSYRLCLPLPLISAGLLSSLQLESIIYASARHEQILPSGERAGFLLGDGAGIGKGRQIAGLIFENVLRGRKKHVWFSSSADLADDATRDLSDIGASRVPQINLPSCSYNDDFQMRQAGVMFCTYSCLICRRGNSSRIDQLSKWCGGSSFEGVMVFDECHRAKNLSVSSTKGKGASKTALAVLEVQRRLPKARIIYVSATGASELSHLGYMQRLGLWGLGTAFKDSRAFVEQISARGVGAMEMCAMDLKSRGMYLSRSLSYRGAEFETTTEDLSSSYAALYDECVTLWRDLKVAFEKMKDEIEAHVTLTPEESRSLRRTMSQFWGAHQRFFNQLCLGAKVPAVVRIGKAELAKGRCVVIGLQSTGESRVAAEINENGFHGKLLSVAEASLKNVVRNLFKIGDEFESCRRGRPIPELRRTRDALLKRIAALGPRLPRSPIDAIIDSFGGPASCAELTGRGSRVVRRDRSSADTPFVYERRTRAHSSSLAVGKGQDNGRSLLKAGEPSKEASLPSPSDAADSVNISERKAFQAGRKLVAIISDAASTGISLHADRRVKNQRRRCHITLELPWSADKAVQQLGRSHRSNQSSAPSFRLLISNIGGEWRFASAVSSRLSQLGALTQGDRRATGGSDLSDFDIANDWGRNALKAMLANLVCYSLSRKPVLKVSSTFITEEYTTRAFAVEAITALRDVGIDLGTKSNRNKAGKVNTFLNRLFGVKLKLQGRLFRHFLDTLDVVVAEAKQTGKFSEGIVDAGAESITLEKSTTIFTDGRSGATIEHRLMKLDRGVSWETAKRRYDEAKELGKDADFFISRNPPFGYPRHSPRRSYLLAIGRMRGQRRSGRSRFFTFMRPNTGWSSSDVHIDNIREKNLKVTDLAKVQKDWECLYAEAKDSCLHYNCHVKPPNICKYGKRTQSYHLITGAILPIWDVVEREFFAASKKQDTKIVRMLTDAGERLVGLHIPSSACIERIKRAVADGAIKSRGDHVADASFAAMSAAIASAKGEKENFMAARSTGKLGAKKRKRYPSGVPAFRNRLRRAQQRGGGVSVDKRATASDGVTDERSEDEDEESFVTVVPKMPPLEENAIEDDDLDSDNSRRETLQQEADDGNDEMEGLELWEEVEISDEVALFTPSTTSIATAQLVEQEDARSKVLSQSAGGDCSGREYDPDLDDDSDDEREINSAARHVKPEKGEDAAEQIACTAENITWSDEHVQCNRCGKWRQMPIHIAMRYKLGTLSFEQRFPGFGWYTATVVDFNNTSVKVRYSSDKDGYDEERVLSHEKLEMLLRKWCKHKTGKSELPSLPDEWFCTDNVWLRSEASCEVPEAEERVPSAHTSANSTAPRIGPSYQITRLPALRRCRSEPKRALERSFFGLPSKEAENVASQECASSAACVDVDNGAVANRDECDKDECAEAMECDGDIAGAAQSDGGDLMPEENVLTGEQHFSAQNEGMQEYEQEGHKTCVAGNDGTFAAPSSTAGTFATAALSLMDRAKRAFGEFCTSSVREENSDEATRGVHPDDEENAAHDSEDEDGAMTELEDEDDDDHDNRCDDDGVEYGVELDLNKIAEEAEAVAEAAACDTEPEDNDDEVPASEAVSTSPGLLGLADKRGYALCQISGPPILKDADASKTVFFRLPGPNTLSVTGTADPRRFRRSDPSTDVSVLVGRGEAGTEAAPLISPLSISSATVNGAAVIEPVQRLVLRWVGGKSQVPAVVFTRPGETRTFGRQQSPPGMASENHTQLPDPMVSRYHATITSVAAMDGQNTAVFGLTLVDRSSTGVFVDGVKVEPSSTVALCLGSRVTFGGPAGPPGTRYIAPGPGCASSFSFVVEAQEWKLCLPDETLQVSRVHARLVYRNISDTFSVVDCDSLNGVFVDRVKIAPGVECPLALGSELVFGGNLPYLPPGSRLRKLFPHVFAFRLLRA